MSNIKLTKYLLLSNEIEVFNITNKTSIIKFNFQNKTYIEIEKLIYKITKNTLYNIYWLDNKFIREIIKFSNKLRRLNMNNDDFKEIYKPRFKKILRNKNVLDFIPYKLTLDNFKEHYVHTIQNIIYDISLNKIKTWSRKHVYYTWKWNCLQLIQIQNNNNIFDLNFTFRSQSFKCLWMDLIQFLLPIIENIIFEWWKIWNIVFVINNLHKNSILKYKWFKIYYKWVSIYLDDNNEIININIKNENIFEKNYKLFEFYEDWLCLNHYWFFKYNKNEIIKCNSKFWFDSEII